MSGKIKLIVTLSIFATLLLILNPSPQIANASPKKAVAPEQTITLPAASFIPTESTNFSLNSFFMGSNQLYGEFYAPIVLPDGATLVKINIFYKDLDSIGIVRADMKRLKLATGISASLGIAQSGSAYTSNDIDKMTINLNKTINQYNAYSLYIRMDYLCRIYGARVIYTMP